MDTNKILKLIKKRKQIDSNDGGVYYKYLDDLESAFKGGSEKEVVEFLNDLSEEQLLCASEVFVELNWMLGDKVSFFKELEKLQKKYPNANLGLWKEEEYYD